MCAVLVLVPYGTVVHLLCFNQPYLGQGQRLKAEECALLSWEMKWHQLRFMLCIRCTVLGHLILMNVCAFDSLDVDINWSFISKMRSLSLFFSLQNLLKGDKRINILLQNNKKTKTEESNSSDDKISFSHTGFSMFEIQNLILWII